MSPELEQFYEKVEDLEIAMMTTIRPDGHLESRAMATQKTGSRRRPLVRQREGHGQGA